MAHAPTAARALIIECNADFPGGIAAAKAAVRDMLRKNAGDVALSRDRDSSVSDYVYVLLFRSASHRTRKPVRSRAVAGARRIRLQRPAGGDIRKRHAVRTDRSAAAPYHVLAQREDVSRNHPQIAETYVHVCSTVRELFVFRIVWAHSSAIYFARYGVFNADRSALAARRSAYLRKF